MLALSRKNLTGLFIIFIKLNCWNLFTETFFFACIDVLCPLIYIKNPHTNENGKKLANTNSVPYFSICNHILRYLLTPWKKYLTFITTNNRKNILLQEWQTHRGEVYARSPRMRRASWISFGMIVTRLAWIAHRLVSSNRPTK